MKPILVHVHIFYPELWEELRECVLNITPYPFELFVTMVAEHKNIIEDIESTFPNARIEMVENRGYDVGPFIHILNQVDLANYSYVVKLHTKRNMGLGTYLLDYDVSGAGWREFLLTFIKTKKNFKKSVSFLEHSKNVGLAGHYKCCLASTSDHENQKDTVTFLEERGFTINPYSFIAGTMFMVRADLLQMLKNMNLSMNDFALSNDTRKAQLAHIIERVLGFIVYYQGCRISDSIISKARQCFYKVVSIVWHFIYQRKITHSGKLRVKIVKIPMPSFLFQYVKFKE